MAQGTTKGIPIDTDVTFATASNAMVPSQLAVKTYIDNFTFVSASYSLTASHALNGGGSSLTTGSTYPITSSWAETSSFSLNSITASYVLSSSGAGAVTSVAGRTGSVVLTSEDLTDLPPGVLARINLSIL